jgi:putative membrane protein
VDSVQTEPVIVADGQAATGFVADGEPRRLHPLTLLLAVARIGPNSLNFLPAILALGFTGRLEWIVPAIALFLLFSLGAAVISWLRFSWRVDADDVTIASGVFSRNVRTIPFDRIQDVNIEQGLLPRLFGLAKVGFETGAGGEGEASLNAIALSEAEALRDHIRSHRTVGVATAAVDGGGEAAAAAPTLSGRLLYAMSPGRLVIAGLFNFSLAVFAILWGLLNQFDNILPFDVFDADVWVGMAKSAGLGDWVNAHQWLAAVGGLISVLLLGATTGIIRMVFTNYGFRLERGERGFRRIRGLTTRTDVTVPIRRVQAAMLTTGIIRRAFGWFELKLQSLASDTKEEADHQVAPLARLAEVDNLLAELALHRAGFEEGAVDAGAWHRSHPVMIAIVPIILVIVTILIALVPPIEGENFRWIALFPGASALFMAIVGWFDWRHRRWHFDGTLLHICDGFLKRRHIILPARNVQSADIAIGPVTRRFGLAAVRLGVPGGRHGQHHISAIGHDQAVALRAALLAVR